MLPSRRITAPAEVSEIVNKLRKSGEAVAEGLLDLAKEEALLIKIDSP